MKFALAWRRDRASGSPFSGSCEPEKGTLVSLPVARQPCLETQSPARQAGPSDGKG